MAPSYIIDLIHTKTNTRYLLRSNEGVLLKHPLGKMKKLDKSAWTRKMADVFSESSAFSIKIKMSAEVDNAINHEGADQSNEKIARKRESRRKKECEHKDLR